MALENQSMAIAEVWGEVFEDGCHWGMNHDFPDVQHFSPKSDG